MTLRNSRSTAHCCIFSVLAMTRITVAERSFVSTPITSGFVTKAGWSKDWIAACTFF